jgi:hypothetical protein
MVDFIETGLENETHPPLDIIQRGVVSKAGDYLNATFTTCSDKCFPSSFISNSY